MEFDIRVWLKSLSLAQFEQAFIENAIDFEVLVTLTNEDLLVLGVSELGNRKKILAAIEKLKIPYPNTETVTKVASERRQITVMFCDLVDSTKLSTQMDPEDLLDLIRCYQKTCTTEVEHFGGFLAKFLGDGVLAYFGYPVSHEDDAERAVHSGLAIISAVADLKPEMKLQVRVGIATGKVVVGEIMGEGNSKEHSIVGTAPNLAARLQSLAAPGTIRVSSSTRTLLGNQFKMTSMGATFLKGFGNAETVWLVEGTVVSATRFGASHSIDLGDLVGRELETKNLNEHLEFAWKGRGQTVLIEGDAGLGKSRLTQGLKVRASHQKHSVIEFQCSSYHTGSPLYPFISEIQRAACLDPKESELSKLKKLKEYIESNAPTLTDSMPLFATLLGIQSEEQKKVLSANRLKNRKDTFALILDLIASQAKNHPMLIVFEDAHWADASSLDMLSELKTFFVNLPILLIITSRPGFKSIGDGANFHRISLGRLGLRSIERIVHKRAGGKALPIEVMNSIVERADGVPYFAEELTKVVLEAGIMTEDGNGYHLRGEFSQLSIPSTLHNSLMARLDRNPDAREIAQIASVIGREFSFDLIKSVANIEEFELISAIEKLENAELIIRQSRGPYSESNFIFYHALVQETAYDSLLKSRRVVFHQRIANVLLQSEPDPSAIADVLAFHFAKADNATAAFKWWTLAGEWALKNCAYVEAASHFAHALELTSNFEELPPMARVKLQISYGNALMSCKGWSAPETTSAFSRARELAAKIPDSDQKFPIMFGLWASSYVGGEFSGIAELSKLINQEIGDRTNTPAAIAARRCSAGMHWFKGDFLAAKREFESGLSFFSAQFPLEMHIQYGADIRVSILCPMAFPLWAIGEWDNAWESMEKGIRLSEEINHVASITYAYAHKSFLAILNNDPAECLQASIKIMKLSKDYGLSTMTGFATFTNNWARFQIEKNPEILNEVRQARANLSDMSVRLFMPVFAAAHALAEFEAGNIQMSISIIDNSLTDNAISQQLHHNSELYRLRARFQLHSTYSDVAAEESLELAVETARAQNAIAYELSSSVDLAELWRRKGKVKAAIEILSNILSRFPETKESAYLKHARNLLMELQAKAA